MSRFCKTHDCLRFLNEKRLTGQQWWNHFYLSHCLLQRPYFEATIPRNYFEIYECGKCILPFSQMLSFHVRPTWETVGRKDNQNNWRYSVFNFLFGNNNLYSCFAIPNDSFWQECLPILHELVLICNIELVKKNKSFSKVKVFSPYL